MELCISPPENPHPKFKQTDMNLGHPLCLPKILTHIGSYLPLFERRYEASRYKFVDKWNPKPLLRAASTCQAWYFILTPIIWKTYDLAMMEKVPKNVLGRNIHHVRNLSLLDKTHRQHADLWNALQGHAHIEKLEIHDAMFPVKKLLGPRNHNLGELMVSGNCVRMHPFLMIFVEKQVHLKVLELARLKFTASDWKRIISNKPHLRKLTIAQQCEFLDHRSHENQDGNTEAEDSTPCMDNAANGNHPSVTDHNTPTSNSGATSGGSKKRKTDEDGGDGSKRLRRAEIVNTKLPDAKNIGTLSVTHLVLQDNRLLLPFQKSILEACPYLDQLEICYSWKEDGGKVATLVRDNCRNLRRLTLTSTRQSWTLAMVDGMPHTVKELILRTGQLDLHIAAAINARKDVLTRLELDFGQGTKGKRRLECILLILQACSELREFIYRNHLDDKLFKEVMFRKPWNLPNLRKLHINDVSPRFKHGSLPKVPSPKGWRQEYLYPNEQDCCVRSSKKIRKQDKALKSSLFDIALLDHVKDLPHLSEVIITGAKYRKKLH